MGDLDFTVRVKTDYPDPKSLTEALGRAVAQGCFRLPARLPAGRSFVLVFTTRAGTTAVKGTAEVVATDGEATWVRFLSASDSRRDADMVLTDVEVALPEEPVTRSIRAARRDRIGDDDGHLPPLALTGRATPAPIAAAHRAALLAQPSQTEEITAIAEPMADGTGSSATLDAPWAELAPAATHEETLPQRRSLKVAPSPQLAAVQPLDPTPLATPAIAAPTSQAETRAARRPPRSEHNISASPTDPPLPTPGGTPSIAEPAKAAGLTGAPAAEPPRSAMSSAAPGRAVGHPLHVGHGRPTSPRSRTSSRYVTVRARGLQSMPALSLDQEGSPRPLPEVEPSLDMSPSAMTAPPSLSVVPAASDTALLPPSPRWWSHAGAGAARRPPTLVSSDGTPQEEMDQDPSRLLHALSFPRAPTMKVTTCGPDGVRISREAPCRQNAGLSSSISGIPVAMSGGEDDGLAAHPGPEHCPGGGAAFEARGPVEAPNAGPDLPFGGSWPAVAERAATTIAADTARPPWLWLGIATACIVLAASVIWWALDRRGAAAQAAAQAAARQLAASSAPPAAAISAPPALASASAAATPPPTAPITPSAFAAETSAGCQLRVSSNANLATLFVEGEPRGQTPATIDVPCRPLTIELRHSRYATATRTVAPAAGVTDVELKLTRPIVTVVILSQPPGATVRINGREVGKTPLSMDVPAFERATILWSASGAVKTQQVYPQAEGDCFIATLTAGSR